jgi:cytochrome d ubiquinol oxidase subunit I
MDELLLARWQFGITTVYHFIFVPLSIGIAPLVAIFQSFYYKTRDPAYDELARFFGKLFVIIFTLGIVTGIVQEFQFGMNWSEYSRFVGDIFGIPLAIEALMAFFLESTFLGLWLFGRNRLPDWLHLLSIWLVAIGSAVSALWILTANAWMQVPVGYVLRNDRAELDDIVAIILNERVWVQFPHVIVGAFLTGALFVVGISGWHLLRKHRVEIFGKSMRIALIMAAVSSLLLATTGHDQAQNTAETQPMKMAAMEGLWESEAPASFSLFAIIDKEAGESRREIRLPYLLSVLAHNDMTSEVAGMRDLQAQMEEIHGPGDYIPPVNTVYWSFRVMVGLGMLFIVYSLLGLVLWWRGALDQNVWFAKVGIAMIFLPFFANASGWIVAEMGRQPWVVYGLMRTADGVSVSVGPISIWISMIGFTLVYGLLAVAGAWLIIRFAHPARYKPDRADIDAEKPELAESAY